MWKFKTFAMTLCMAGAACAQPEPEPDPRADALDAFVPRLLEATDGNVPGLSIAVVHGDDAVYLRGFGMADVEAGVPAGPETAFYIASSTKSFTALAAALVEADGRLDLDDSMAEHARGVTFDPTVRAPDVTLRHLLTHTHGMANHPIVVRTAFTGDHTSDELWRLLAETRPNEDAPLGTFAYSNVGYNIFSLFLDRAAGKPWQDVLDERIFEPLGMAGTTAYASEAASSGRSVAQPYSGFGEDGRAELVYLAKQDNTMQAAGGMYTTAADAARWLEVQLNAGRLDGRQVFPAAVIRETHEPFATTDAAFGPFTRTGYALGWYAGEYDGSGMRHHFGGFGGAHSHISFLPDEGLGVAVFVNEAGIGGNVAVTVASLAYDLWLDKEGALDRAEAFLAQVPARVEQSRERVAADRAERAAREWTLGRPMADYAGTYVSPSLGTMVISAESGALRVRFGNMNAVATPFTEPETIRVELIPDQGQVVGFEFGASDRPDAVMYDGYRFVRTGS